MDHLTIKTKDRRVESLEQICRSDIVYVWGGGSYSNDIIDYIRSVGGYTGEIIRIVDDEYYKDGVDAISFSGFLKAGDKRSPIVFGFYNYPVIREKKEKWACVFPRMYDFHLAVVNGKRLEWNPLKAKDREAEYSFTYNLLSNEKSRIVMQRYLNAATAGGVDELFMECYDSCDYFNDITKGLKIDTLIDCGAFDGDSIHEFVLAFPEYKKIIAIEPDPGNVESLCNRQERERIHDLTVIQKGLGSQERELRFKANGESNSFLDESGEQIIHVTTLDRIITAEVNLGRIFLKMDIEGSELEALHGAEKLIREHRPVMAICVYHKEEDLIEIPQFIHRVVGERTYEYYLGYHGLDLAELAFYAIPKECKRQ